MESGRCVNVHARRVTRAAKAADRGMRRERGATTRGEGGRAGCRAAALILASGPASGPASGLASLLAWGVAVLLAGCGPHWLGDGLDIAECPAGLLPGELVITEVMPSPGDGGAEWIEIFNAASEPVDLGGVVITVSTGESSPPQRHVLGNTPIEPGAYFVLGERAQSAAPVDHVYGEALGPLPDDGARVTLRCDVIEVDAVAYPAAAPGAAVGLSGALVPNAVANDEAASWCVASAAFAPGLTGSPGARNESCAGAPGDVPPDSCEDDGAVRAIVPPAIGDLVITEIMANPEAVPDAQGEWLEVHVVRDVDLNGLAVSTEAGATDADVLLADPACVRVAAGTHLVLAASMDPATNGGLAPIAELAGSLRNTGGTLSLVHDGTVLDTIAWLSAPAGASLALDPAYRSPVHNDLAEHWCASKTTPYGNGDVGTPGAENAPCSQPPPDDPGDPDDPGNPGDPPAGMCDDAGVLRPIMTPAAGTVRITEIMADPGAAPDASGEWLELAFGAAADLNGLELGKLPGQVLATITSAQCLPVLAGAHVILARSADPARNGGLPRVDAGLTFGLLNGGDTLFIGVAGAVLDAVTHAAATAGVSASLDQTDGITWCLSPEGTTYGAGDRGSPGASNPACPVLPPVPIAPQVVRSPLVR